MVGKQQSLIFLIFHFESKSYLKTKVDLKKKCFCTIRFVVCDFENVHITFGLRSFYRISNIITFS